MERNKFGPLFNRSRFDKFEFSRVIISSQNQETTKTFLIELSKVKMANIQGHNDVFDKKELKERYEGRVSKWNDMFEKVIFILQ